MRAAEMRRPSYRELTGKRLGSQPQSLGTGRKVGCEPVRMALHFGNGLPCSFPIFRKKIAKVRVSSPGDALSVAAIPGIGH